MNALLLVALQDAAGNESGFMGLGRLGTALLDYGPPGLAALALLLAVFLTKDIDPKGGEGEQEKARNARMIIKASLFLAPLFLIGELVGRSGPAGTGTGMPAFGVAQVVDSLEADPSFRDRVADLLVQRDSNLIRLSDVAGLTQALTRECSNAGLPLDDAGAYQELIRRCKGVPAVAHLRDLAARREPPFLPEYPLATAAIPGEVEKYPPDGVGYVCDLDRGSLEGFEVDLRYGDGQTRTIRLEHKMKYRCDQDAARNPRLHMHLSPETYRSVFRSTAGKLEASLLAMRPPARRAAD